MSFFPCCLFALRNTLVIVRSFHIIVSSPTCVYQRAACKNNPVIHVILIDQRSQCRCIHPIPQITEPIRRRPNFASSLMLIWWALPP